MPEENEKDLEDILEDVREEMTFHFVKHMDEVLSHTLVRKLDSECCRSDRRPGGATRFTAVGSLRP